MAFQNSCYGIVLDAVLTDIGRQRMVDGKFRITKFALGDDEIDYALYITASGGVPEDDTDVRTTPIMEAYAGQNANINHGLQNFIRGDILYYPTIQANTIIEEALNPHSDGFYYFSTNKQTTRKLKSVFGDSKFIVESGLIDKTKFVIESGIASDEITPNEINKERFIIEMGLYDKYFLAYCDNRYFDEIMVCQEDSMFENDIADNLYSRLEPLKTAVKISLPSISEFYDVYRFNGIDNNILVRNGHTGQKYSSLKGPRSTIASFNLKVKNEMTSDAAGKTDFKYNKFGTVGNSLFGGSDLYDFIDTTIYIQGLSSNATISLPIRIIRYAGT